ncbi:hypothetical protein P389DRAFT_167255, partial [Cystobasidium minutum MCA 4210]|uniref:uncharacterized protein n=1 Tax=Cystobasidium minutum MCA 4210 TaxID=1397322 RepID=UPI0034CD6E24|eukprot:jgi/Rhomi1/167255/fgenesh1_kg.2_\
MSLDPSEEDTPTENLAVLAEYRQKHVRSSEEVVRRGERVLRAKGALKRMGEEVWPFLEQLGFAALDTGKNDLAQICIERLEDKFPKSPRVDALQGLLLEKESLTKAKEFYEGRLSEDENNVLVRKRLIALHLHSPSFPTSEANAAGLSLQKGIALLVDHLDTVYNDAEGWSELASVYEKLGMYAQSLSCLGDLILLEPTNTFHILRHAETAYTIGDYALAYRGFLRALEMAGPMTEGGLGRRAGLGAKLALRRLNALQSNSSSTEKEKKGKGREIALNSVESDVSPPKKAKDIDALITQELLVVYSRGWMDLGDRVAGHAENKALKMWLARQAQEN